VVPIKEQALIRVCACCAAGVPLTRCAELASMAVSFARMLPGQANCVSGVTP